jgi:integrase
MSIYRQKASSLWWVDLTIGGRRIRQSTGTDNRRKAQEHHDRIKARLWEEERLGIRPRYTWREAVVRYLREAEAEGKASLENDRHALRWLDRYLGGKHLDEIDKDVVSFVIEERQKPYVRIYATGQERECKPGVDTINRFLTTLRAVLNKAAGEWEWVDRVPRVKALKGARSRVRWITRLEADALIAELPEHLAAMVEFTLQTGLRRANVTHLEWSQVDLARKTAWVLGDQTKNGKALAVPLNDKAMSTLEGQLDKDPRWVFCQAQGARPSDEHPHLVRSGRARGPRGFLLARLASHLGELACAERNTAARPSGTRRLVFLQDGAAVRPPEQRAPAGVGGAAWSGAGRRQRPVWHGNGSTRRVIVTS